MQIAQTHMYVCFLYNLSILKWPKPEHVWWLTIDWLSFVTRHPIIKMTS